jgi:hypothetical protein
MEDLERRIEELEELDEESSATDVLAQLAEWTQRVRIGASANTGWYGGQQDSVFHSDNFQVWDARFFLDAELGDNVRVGDTTVVRNVGFSFEWDLVRLGMLKNDVGDLIADFQQIGDSEWTSLQVGRFEIPFGEGYLLFSKGYRDNPFITNAVGVPWFWDEGIKLYGSDERHLFGYSASITDGETSFNIDHNADYQYTLRLYTDPTDWLRLSVSGLYTGKLGSRTDAGQGSLWVGESWARAFGSGTSVQSYNHGVAVDDGPLRIEETYMLGADAIVHFDDQVRVWLAYGSYSIDQDGGTYDRRLHYWIAELLLYGGLVMPEMKDFYVGFRSHGYGSYDSDEGYLLDFRYAKNLGYNMESLTGYSAVVGWKMLRYVTIRAEYTHLDIDLVRGVPGSIRNEADGADSWGVEVGVAF